jgi:nicotinic acid mononucleotide adenylyltransferase
MRDVEKIVLYGGAFNPPGQHHSRIVDLLVSYFDRVFIIPCGRRSDKNSTYQISLEHRQQMVEMEFGDRPKVKLDLSDLQFSRYTPTYLLNERYQRCYPAAEIWHAMGQDLVSGGRQGRSLIQRTWRRGRWVWQNLNFAVIAYTANFASVDLPPHSQFFSIDNLYGRSTLIRRLVRQGRPFEHLVSPPIAVYIKKEGLYR